MATPLSCNPCACGCGRQASPPTAMPDSAGALWRFDCVATLLTDVRTLQNLTPGALVILADLFASVDARALGRVCVRALPRER